MLHINFYILLATVGINNGQEIEGPNLESHFKISADLLRLLENGESRNVIINFKNCTKEALERATSLLTTDDRGERAKAIYQSLLEHSQISQSGLEQMLSTRSGINGDINFRKFWISNEMWVSGADLKLVREIAEDPSVSGIKEEPIFELLDYESGDRGDFAPRPEDGTIQWNIERVQAPEAWQELGGKGGEGIVVGVIDSGARGSHETLKDNFLGDYGWYDPFYKKLEPWDDAGHGTSVTGAAVGSRGIGVAPGAKWAACKGCNRAANCATADILACMEHFACPSLADGSNRDCSKVPHIVVNSWGRQGEHEHYDTALQTWQSIGIVPVFAIGNLNSCGTTHYPGNHGGVIGVGSISIDNTTDYVSSSKGPTRDNRIKPDIVAPGENVISASSSKDDGYYTQSGTSFSCPQVAGVLALILSLDEKISYESLKLILFNNTEKSILQIPTEGNGVFPYTCGSVKDGEIIFPNNVYGFGLANALDSIMAYKEMGN